MSTIHERVSENQTDKESLEKKEVLGQQMKKEVALVLKLTIILSNNWCLFSQFLKIYYVSKRIL